MKKLTIIYTVVSAIVLVSCICRKQDEYYKIKPSNYKWIPIIKGSMVFESNESEWLFPNCYTKTEYDKSRLCFECCNKGYTEYRRMNLENSNELLQAVIGPKPIGSTMGFLKFSYSDSNRIQVYEIPIELDSIDNWSRQNNLFFSTIQLNNNEYNDVYCFNMEIKDSTFNQPKKIYYTQNAGFVGIEMLNGILWNRKK